MNFKDNKEKIDIKSMITIIRQNNGLLSLIDKYKTDNNIKLKNVLEEFSNIYKIDVVSHAFYNQYQLLSSLMTYIVYPKEILFANISEKILVKDLCSKWALNVFDNQEMFFSDFLRHMRNAISHSHIEFNEKLEFVFTDKDIFIKLNSNELKNFTQALAWWVITNDIELKGL